MQVSDKLSFDRMNDNHRKNICNNEKLKTASNEMGSLFFIRVIS